MPVIGTLPTDKKKMTVKPVVVLRIIQALIVVVLLIGGYGISLIVAEYDDLQTLTETLSSTSIYADAKNVVRSSISTSNSDQKNQFLKELQQKENLVDVIAMNKVAEDQNLKTQQYLDSIQMPYENFLHYFLMPPLNIWKNRFTGKIDDTLIGQKYLKENQYLDVNQITRWTDFFKDIGKDSPKNEIKNVNIGDVVEDGKNGTFKVLINVDFVAQTKRSFLLLVDKLSTTSNKENLGLMNEFFFNLWLVLKEREMGGSGSVASGGVVTWSSTGDQQLGIDFYKWVVDPKSTFVKENDVITAIKRFANCETNDMNICYFKFREKIRNLPSIAYTIGMPNTNKVNELRRFLQNLAPLINIQTFTFRRMNSTSTSSEDRGYEGSLSIEAYGRSLAPGEVDEIAVYLGSICLGENQILSPGAAITQLEKTIKQATQITQISNEKSKQLNDLRVAIQKIEAEYNGLPGLKRVVKLFELYRMLIDNKVCSTKN